MALAPADFYAYSRATGVPVPEDPEERAEMAPAVASFRRNQLKTPEQQGPDPISVGIGLGLAAAGGIGATLGLRKLFKQQPSIPKSGKSTITQADLKRYSPVTTVAEANIPKYPTSAPSKVAQPEAAVKSATVDLSTFLEDPEFIKQLELEEAELVSASPETQQEMRRQARVVQNVESKEKAQGKNVLLDLRREQEAARNLNVDDFLAKNEPLYRRLVNAEDIKEKRVLGEQYLEDLRSGAATGFVAPSSPLPQVGTERAYQPGTFSDLTTIQNNLLNQAKNQTINAVESGEDQVAQRAQRKTMALSGVRASRQTSSPVMQKLYDSGLGDFEINARVNAFAQYGKTEFLDPEYNAATVGPENFARTLEIAGPEFDNAGRLIGGEYASGTQTVYAGKEKYTTLPEGEAKRSAFASQQPAPVRTRSQNDEEKWEPISEALTGLTGGVSTAAVPIKQSEQYEQAINNFRGYWDEQLNTHISGGRSSITRPARENRYVDTFDLDLPVRLKKVEGLSEQGELVAKTQTVLYRDILTPEQVADIERGVPTVLDVPFLVNKNRAIEVAKANPTIQNRLDAEHYRATGRALTRAHAEIVGPYASDEFIADLEPARFFNLTENVSTKAVPNVTPEFGRGSQKGRLVGGTAERPVREPVYNLQYHPHTTTKGEAILINKTPVFNNKGQVELVGITDLTQLNEIGVAKHPDTEAELYVSPGQQVDFVVTQPMSVKRPVQRGAAPVAQLRKQGISSKTGQPYDFMTDVYEATDVIVQAPLQVLDAETGKPVSNKGQIKRSELAGFLNQLRTPGADYAELGALANRYLAEQKGITLPVLDSPTAFDFIESVIGRPGSRASRKTLVTINQQTGDVYPLSKQDAVTLGFVSSSSADPTLARKYVGPPSLDIRESPKTMEEWSRMGEGEGDWEQYKDFGDEELGVANVGVLEPRKQGPLQQKRVPALSGAGAELQDIREQLAKIKATEPKISTASLPSNLEAVTQQLMAQAGRRAGKRRNR
jgi:hypothetical protein